MDILIVFITTYMILSQIYLMNDIKCLENKLDRINEKIGPHSQELK